MKYCFYARTSTLKQDKGLESQIYKLQRYVEDNNIHDFEIYADKGISGAKASRPEFDRLMKDCREGKVTAVVTCSFSRISRSTTHLLKVLDFLNEREIKFISLSESLDTGTAMGRMLFTIISALSTCESSWKASW